MEEEKLIKLKKEFMSWSGFELEGETLEELQATVKQRSWSLECEIHSQSKYFDKELEKLFPEE